MFELSIETDGAAFVEGGPEEVARILREVAERLEQGGLTGRVSDRNGNTCGTFTLRSQGD